MEKWCNRRSKTSAMLSLTS